VYSCKKDEANLAHYQSLFEIMQDHFSFTEFSFEGEGKIPYSKNSEDEFVRYFKYETKEDFEFSRRTFQIIYNGKFGKKRLDLYPAN